MGYRIRSSVVSAVFAVVTLTIIFGLAGDAAWAAIAAKISYFMQNFTDIFADVFLIGAIIGCAYLLMAALAVAAFRRRAHPPTEAPVPVTILVPLCGDEPGLADRLLALCEQDYAGPIQIVCGARNGSDPALDVVKTVAASRPRHTIEWYAAERLHGRNLKVSNLINMTQHARHDTFLLVDSDIEVEPDFVSSMVGTLQRPGVGAVTCLSHAVAAGGLWARLATLRVNADFLPKVIFALTFRLEQPCFGYSIALTRETLHRIGGLHAFADKLWEDYAIGEAIRELGGTVVVPSFALGHVFAERSARDFFANELRAARTIKGINPLRLCRQHHYLSLCAGADCRRPWRRHRGTGGGADRARLPHRPLPRYRATLRLRSDALSIAAAARAV